MEWTREKPTQEGWYWACRNKGKPRLIEVRKAKWGWCEGKLAVWIWREDGYPVTSLPKHVWWWLGPIPQPTPPTNEEGGSENE